MQRLALLSLVMFCTTASVSGGLAIYEFGCSLVARTRDSMAEKLYKALLPMCLRYAFKSFCSWTLRVRFNGDRAIAILLSR